MAGRKEYELLLKLSAALGGNFNSTFKTAMNTTKELQNSLQKMNKVQGDITSYKKTQDAISTNKSKVQDLTTEHSKLQQRLTETAAKEKELEKALNKSKKATGDGTEEYKRLESELKKTRENKEKLTNQTEKASTAIEKAKNKIGEQEGKLSELGVELKKAGINTDNLTQENEKLKKTYEDLKKSQEGYARANAELEKNKAAISATGRELAKTIGIATAAGTAVYAGAIKPAMEFESAFAGVKKTVEGTPAQLLAIQNGIRKMAVEIPLGTTEIAAISEAAGQLGIETESILGFTRVMADLGVTTNLAGEEAASTLAKFANITGMSQGNFGRLGSTIVALGNNLATTESDIAAMSLRLAGAGKQVGLSEAQILSYAGALSSVGIEAEAGGSAFSKVMNNMQLAVETGNKDLINFAKVAGVSAADFKAAFQTDAAGAINLFIKGLGESQAKGESAIKVLDDMGITEVRMRDALLRAAGASDVFTESLELGTQAWQENKALSEEAAQRYATTESAIQMMKNAFSDIAISLGGLFLPKLAETAKSVSEAAVSFSEWVKENKETIATVVKVVAGLTAAKIAFLAIKMAVLSVIGVQKTLIATKAAYNVIQTAVNSGTKLSTALTLVDTKTKAGQNAVMLAAAKAAWANVTATIKDTAVKVANAAAWVASKAAMIASTVAMKAAAAAQWLLNAAMTANPIGLIIAGVAALIAIVVLLVKNWDKVKDALQKVWEAVKGVFGKIGDFFAGVFDKIKAPFVVAINWVKENWKTIALFIINPFAGIFKLLYDKFEGFRNFVNGIVEKVKGIFGAIAGWFNNNVIQPIVRIFAPIVQKIGEIFAKIWEIITVLFGVLASWFYDKVITPVVGFFKTLISTIGGIFKSVWDAITGVFFAVVEWFSAKFTAVWEAIKAVFSSVAGWFSEKFTAAWEAVKLAFTPIGEFFAAAWNTVTTVFSNVVGWFSAKFGEAWEAIKAVFSTVGTFFQGLWDGITAIFTKIGTTVGNAIGDAFKFVVNSIIGFAEGMINKFIGGINKAINLINKIPGVDIEPLTLLQVPRLEKGSDYTPDTFIAGDVGGKGGELVTGARGRKVFTAAQTDAIFANINRAKAITAATAPDAPRVPEIMERVGGFISAIKSVAVNHTAANNAPTLQTIPTKGSGAQSFTIQYSPTIYVDGNKPGDLEEKLKQNNESLLQTFKEFLRRERENERRTAYA